ncbi:amino acid permease [Catenulispora sp. NL8]|uniref:Amino acid permease n=1 Tax=Catenulispora pinistramenti TaxID=2705254 RepID=A0ABS5KP02_9ACTN|nr:amino acid permease [Catenulispora pinistramenti]MBS2547757.1 amino acid permease [Catenulispora pinistramenti]
MSDTAAQSRTAQSPRLTERQDDLYLARRTKTKRETRRRLNLDSATALSVSIISFLTGTLGLYGQGAAAGGPAVMIWTWVALFIPIWCVARAMGEICSAFPTLGGPFFWTAALAKKHGRPASWLVAWLNLTGDFAGTAFAAFSAALFLGRLLAVETGFSDTLVQDLAISLAIMAVAGILNSFAVDFVARINRTSMWVHMGGAVVISFCLIAFAHTHQSAKFVFFHYANNTDWHSPIYVVALGAVVPLLTFTGFDANGHKADETLGASRVAPKAMTRAVEWSFVGGLMLLISLSFGVQNLNAELGTAFPAVPAQIILDALNGPLAVFLLVWILIGQMMCTISCVDAGSRMVVGAARENALIFNGYLHHFTTNTRVPLRAVWAMTLGSAAFCVPGAFGLPWFYGITAYAAIALFLVYVIPTFLRLIHPSRFTPGDLQLKHPKLVGWTAVGSIVLASIAAGLPVARDYMHWTTMNWALPGVLALVVLVLLGYMLFGRGTYEGPQQHITAEELAALEADL